MKHAAGLLIEMGTSRESLFDGRSEKRGFFSSQPKRKD